MEVTLFLSKLISDKLKPLRSACVEYVDMARALVQPDMRFITVAACIIIRINGDFRQDGSIAQPLDNH